MKPLALLRKICQNKQLSSYLRIVIFVTHVDLYLPGWEYLHILEKKSRVPFTLGKNFIEKGFIFLREADLLVEFEGELRVEFDVEGRS